MLKYPESLLLAHAGVIADLLELLPAEVAVPVSVPHGEGYQDLVLLLPPPLLQGTAAPAAPEPAQALVLRRKQMSKGRHLGSFLTGGGWLVIYRDFGMLTHSNNNKIEL